MPYISSTISEHALVDLSISKLRAQPTSRIFGRLRQQLRAGVEHQADLGTIASAATESLKCSLSIRLPALPRLGSVSSSTNLHAITVETRRKTCWKHSSTNPRPALFDAVDILTMDLNAPNPNSWPAKLVTRIGKHLRSDKAFTQEAIRKNEERAVLRRQKHAEKYGHTQKSRAASMPNMQQHDVNELGERHYSVFSDATTLADNRDHTEMMHGLAHHDSFDSLLDQAHVQEKLKDPYFDSTTVELAHPKAGIYSKQFARLPEELWQCVTSYLNAADAASLAISTQTLYVKLGTQPLLDLNSADHERAKTVFLTRLDHHFPRHLLCFQCNRYHLRLHPGKEVLKADYVANPLFTCPNVRSSVLPRMRLVHGRELPYAYVQLATRAARYSTPFGIDSETLSRRWKCKDSEWNHRTRYMIHNHHLLMRVVSSAFALPNAEMTETRVRHLLYDREEYTPYFSVCTHWKDGILMEKVKCALSHVPQYPKSYFQQLKQAPKLNRALANPNFIVRMCDECRPARRCPECPTEYLIEIQMAEDKNDPVRPFKHSLVVTRWSDLGDGSSPHASPEWVAINGKEVGAEEEGYASFSNVGRRAVSGIFESRISGSVPGQRMLSMNPKNEKLGEEGHGWY